MWSQYLWHNKYQELGLRPYIPTFMYRYVLSLWIQLRYISMGVCSLRVDCAHEVMSVSVVRGASSGLKVKPRWRHHHKHNVYPNVETVVLAKDAGSKCLPIIGSECWRPEQGDWLRTAANLWRRTPVFWATYWLWALALWLNYRHATPAWLWPLWHRTLA